MFFGFDKNRFEEIPYGIQGLSLFRPDVLMITAVAPGSLLISRGGGQIGRFNSGKFIRATPDAFQSTSLGKFLIKNIELFEEYEPTYWHYYRDLLRYLLSEACICGHGGTIILVPEEKIPEAKNYSISKYSFEDNLAINKRMINSIKEEQLRSPFALVHRNKLMEVANFVSRLSRVDGALILSSAFKVISFGSTLCAPKWNGNILDAFDGKCFDATKLGTRHNSAINFVGNCVGSIAFVLSQDGPVRGLTKVKDNVRIWTDCLSSMFVDLV